jgi:phosphopantothenoylcysteine synthetase/decarboxylase
MYSFIDFSLYQMIGSLGSGPPRHASESVSTPLWALRSLSLRALRPASGRDLYTTGMAKVLVGVTGGIAAYKAPGVIRRLREAGHEVRTIATEAAFRFIPEETLAIAAGGSVHTDKTWWERSGRIEHVSLARWADLVLVVPATADAIARAAIGLGDDLLSATILAGAKRVLWAPAMNPEMWDSPATKRNVETLKSWGHRFVGPEDGLMASAQEEPGVGRLAEEPQIVAAAEKALSV